MADSPTEAEHESEVTPPVEENSGFDDETKRAIAEVYLTEGDDAHERKDFNEAINLYKEGIKTNCKDDELNAKLKRAIVNVYKDKGNKAFTNKDFNNAVDFYTDGLQMNYKDDELNAKLYSNRATAYFYLGKYEETIFDAQIALDLQPTYIKALERGASAFMELGMFQRVIDWCDKGLAINKENKTLVDLRSRSVGEQNRSKGNTQGIRGGAGAGFPGVGGPGGFPGAGSERGFLEVGEGFPESVTGGGDTPILNDLFSDKELLAAFQDPATMQAFQDVSQTPANISKYRNMPKLKTIIDKLEEKFGPAGDGPPPESSTFGGGFPIGMGFGNMFGGP